MSARILVVLPVYNGVRYLREQLDSILGQEFADFRIICRDDGSSDGSPAVLAEYAARFPEKFSLLMEPRNNLGASAAFSLLLSEALKQGDQQTYFALSDQDDIWHPHKLQRQQLAMQQLERAGPGPAVVHSDLRVIAADGQVLAASLMRFQGLRPDRSRFASRLLSNAVTGCSMLLNRPLLELALPIPPEAVMHDWWMALVASAFGRIEFVNQALLDYRQHAANTVGAQAQRGLSASEITGRFLGNADEEFYREVLRQAEAFERRYTLRLGGWQRLVLRASRGLGVRWPLWQRPAYHLLRRL